MSYLTYGEFSFRGTRLELNQNRTDIYFRDKEILYLIKLLILGGKRFELLKAIAIEFTAQPFLPIKEASFRACAHFIIVKNNLPRATSTTRTVFRLNTNQKHIYEDC